MDRNEYGQRRSVLWSENEVLVLARTIYGEARGENDETKKAVANVVINRVKNPKWWGKTVKEVCLARKQFSCFNFSDPNFEKLIKVTIKDKTFQECFGIAYAAVKKLIPDNTNGATHYHNKDIDTIWDDNMEIALELNKLVFYKSVSKDKQIT